jgi:CIC family chloride channel protein
MARSPRIPQLPKVMSRVDWQKLLAVRSPAKIYFYSVLIGLGAGGIALAYNALIHSLEGLTFREFAGVDLGSTGFQTSQAAPALEFNPLYFFILPILGGALSGLWETWIMPAARADTINRVLHIFHHKAGLDRGRTALSKFGASILTLTSGGSAGREGPLGLIGASAASLLARYLKVGPKAARSLYLAGMAGTLGAIFQTPLGAALLTAEVIYTDDIESDSLLPCVISSIVSYFLFTSFVGFEYLFQLPDWKFENWNELIFYGVLAVLCYVFGLIFVRGLDSLRAFYDRLQWPFFLKVASGGLVVGIISLFSYESIGTGFGFLQNVLNGVHITDTSPLNRSFLKAAFDLSPISATILFLLIVVILKIIATTFTVAAGGCGGIFGPSLFLGGLLGAITGSFAVHFFPGMVTGVVPFVVVGMGGFLAGVANTPLASLIMVCELTGSYQLMPAIIIVIALSLIISQKVKIYGEQRTNRFDSPAHSWDMIQDFLREIKVSDCIDTERTDALVAGEYPVKKLYKLTQQTRESDLIIYTAGTRHYMGMLSLRHVTEDEGRDLRLSRHRVDEIIEEYVPPLSPEDSLSTALEKLVEYDLDKLPVVSDQVLVGYATFRDILNGYQKGLRREHLRITIAR